MCWLPLAVFAIQLFVAEAQSVSNTFRIVGGSPTTIEQFPFVAQLLVDIYKDGRYVQICAGSILTVKHILSAAHCFQYNVDKRTDLSLPAYWNVRVGSSYRSYGGELFGVQKFIRHPDFNQTYYDNDVAIVILSTAMRFGYTVRQVTIPEQGIIIADFSPVTVVGWGAQMIDGAPSEQLVRASMATVNLAQCQSRYSTVSVTISNAMMCAGLLDIGGVDGCNGDSGGPMTYNGVVVGIVSFGHSCGSAYYPGVYTKVSHFTNWIVNTVNSNYL